MNKEKKKKTKLFRFFPYFKTDWFWLFSNVISSGGAVFIGVAETFYIRNIIDAALNGKRESVFENSKFLLILLIAGVAVVILRHISAGYFSSGFVYRFKKKIVEHIQRLKVDVIERYQKGDIVSRLNGDLNKVKTFFETQLPLLILHPFMFAGGAVFLFLVNWKLLLITIIPIPLGFLFTMLATKSVGRFTENIYKAIGQATGVFYELILGFEAVKVFNITNYLFRSYSKNVNEGLKNIIDIVKRTIWMGPIIVLIRLGPSILCITVGGYFTLKNEITIGELIAFFHLLDYIINPISMFFNTMTGLREGMGAATRLFEILDEPVEAKKKEEYRVLGEPQPIEFTNVSFSYNQGERESDKETDKKIDTEFDAETIVLDNVNMKVEYGKTVAIVGASGSGKSTLLKLIAGFYTQSGGSIKVFQNDINNWNLDALRKHIAYVSQDPFLFPCSVMENIRLGNPDATDAMITEAAEKANVHEFVEKLEDGYNTLAGENGVRFSVGQKQRICLARAIVKDARLLLLDEPTSSLDSHSEALFQKTLSDYKHTILIVSHRLSIIENAHNIIVLDNGKIVETGTHHELLKKQGTYYNLYSTQFLHAKESE